MMSTLSWTSSAASWGKPLEASLGGAELEGDVATLDIAEIAHPLAQLAAKRLGVGGADVERADACNLGRLSPHRERPRERRAADELAEIATSHGGLHGSLACRAGHDTRRARSIFPFLAAVGAKPTGGNRA